MNAARHSFTVGLKRGWRETVLSLRSPQDQGFYIVLGLLTVGYLYLRRDSEIEGVDLAFPILAMPGLLAGIIVFGLVAGPTYQLAMEREDGTLLRAKSTPHGIRGYVVGQVVLHSLSLLPTLLVVVVPSALMFGAGSQRGLAGWLMAAGVIVLGLMAVLPIGIIIGSLVPGVQKAGTWGFMPVMALSGISGIFFPITAMWGWVQAVAQFFPMYWIGLGLRASFLPDEAAVAELGESWRTWETVGVLGAWAVLGMVLTPIVLKRMAQRQSGAAVAEAREKAAQWVR